jgi:hypothetical protein
MSGGTADPNLPARLAARLGDRGLLLRGGFLAEPGEGLPASPGDGPARTVLMVGNAGSVIWPHFRAWLARQPAGLANPLDQWTRAVVEPIASEFGARAVFPFDRPWPPFQQWAMRAEGLRPSPLGILMHPEFGLWHAYRAALLFNVEIPIQPARNPIHACDVCVEQPCLSACPVDAFSGSRIDAQACRGYLATGASSSIDSTAGAGLPDCMGEGCAARNACPVGTAYRYDPEQMRFHMAAFGRG